LLIYLPFFFCCFSECEESEAIATVHEAVKQGINFIDTAPWYGQGRSEELLGKVTVFGFS
jgi:aryl-alcohol dehydrogenase-like predicted oxidoreductase